MLSFGRLTFVAILICPLLLPSTTACADSGESTRPSETEYQSLIAGGSYPFREKSDYILKELDLKPGDVVVDIGAGDGWWSRQMADAVGEEGTIHAAEVQQRLVDTMKEQYADVPQMKPYLCPTDGTGLPEDSCDLAFLSMTYHHLDAQGRVDYLRHLTEDLKPTGRLCVIEMYAGLGSGPGSDAHAYSPGLLEQEAAEAGWVLVRCELLRGTRHFLAIFVQRELFGPTTAARDGLGPPRGRGARSGGFGVPPGPGQSTPFGPRGRGSFPGSGPGQ